jgi:hypothetical protein
LTAGPAQVVGSLRSLCTTALQTNNKQYEYTFATALQTNNKQYEEEYQLTSAIKPLGLYRQNIKRMGLKEAFRLLLVPPWRQEVAPQMPPSIYIKLDNINRTLASVLK